jgi:GNAT superfamily N-acetyltransferase
VVQQKKRDVLKEQELKTLGYKSLRQGPVDFRRCPGCHELTEGDALMGFGERAALEARCFHCNRDFPWDTFENAQQEETFATCAACGNEMPLTPYRLAFIGYLCTCNNYVAIPFEDQIFQPRELVTPGWNPGLRDRGTPLSTGCAVALCETARDKQVLTILQLIAKETNPEFRFANDENQALLAFDPFDGTYLGFLMYYNSEEYSILNQLFILDGFRRKGYASAVVTHWVEHYARRIAEQFAIESPNANAIALHLKLGHLREEGDNLIGVNCIILGPGL